MTTTQRQRPARQSPPTPDPASRGLILVAAAVVLGVILLIKGGGVGFDRDSTDVQIGDRQKAEDTTPAQTPSTTAPAPPSTAVPPADLKVVALNAAGVNGYAGKAQQFLGVAGYTSVTPITAASPSQTTTVYFADGFEVDARVLASLFDLAPEQVQPMPSDGATLARTAAEFPADTNVAVVLGPDVSNTVEGAAANSNGGAGQSGGSAGSGT